MSFTPGTRGHGPGEAREPGEVLVSRPVLANVRFPKRHDLEPVPVRVLEELHVNPSASEQRVVAAGQRQSAGDEVDVRADSHLVSARPAQYQGVGAAAPCLLRRGGTKEETNGDVMHHKRSQLPHEQPRAPSAPHRCWARARKASQVASLSC